MTMDQAEFQGQAAGIVTRTMACAVDALVVVTALALGWVATAAVVFLARPARFSFPSPSWLLVVVLADCVSVLYLAGCWATSGRTIGAQLLGLRVVSRGGGRLGWTRSILRAAAYVVFPVGLAWSAVDRRSRSVQDLLLGSAVVYDWIPRVPAEAVPDARREVAS
jgi:uncharacterized RDD family membrane protein YckC